MEYRVFYYSSITFLSHKYRVYYYSSITFLSHLDGECTANGHYNVLLRVVHSNIEWKLEQLKSDTRHMHNSPNTTTIIQVSRESV